MSSPDFTRYHVGSGRRDEARRRRVRAIEWALIGAAVVVIAVFAYLLLSTWVR